MKNEVPKPNVEIKKEIKNIAYDSNIKRVRRKEPMLSRIRKK